MLTKSLLTISLLLPLAAWSAAANAGSTITDKNYWPSAVRQSTEIRTAGPRDVLNSAFAYDRDASDQQLAVAGDSESRPHYHGGPKSPY